MTWEAFGALSEFFGAIAVVASLVYLSRQLRLSRVVDQLATFQSIVNGFTNHTDRFFSAENELALRGLTDRDTLSEADRLLFDHLLANVLNHGEMAQGALQAGLLTEAEMENLDYWLREQLFCYPGAREWLEANASLYPAEYLARLRKASAAAAAAGEV